MRCMAVCGSSSQCRGSWAGTLRERRTARAPDVDPGEFLLAGVAEVLYAGAEDDCARVEVVVGVRRQVKVGRHGCGASERVGRSVERDKVRVEVCAGAGLVSGVRTGMFRVERRTVCSQSGCRGQQAAQRRREEQRWGRDERVASTARESRAVRAESQRCTRALEPQSSPVQPRSGASRGLLLAPLGRSLLLRSSLPP